jgi:hypothetical protein
MWGACAIGPRLIAGSAQLFLILNLDSVDNRYGGVSAPGRGMVGRPRRYAFCTIAVPGMTMRAGGTPSPQGARCPRYVSHRARAATEPTAHAHGSAAVGTEGLSAQLSLILNLDSVDDRCGRVCAAGRRVVAPAWRHVLCAMAVPAMTGPRGRDARAPPGKMPALRLPPRSRGNGANGSCPWLCRSGDRGPLGPAFPHPYSRSGR